MIAVSFPFSSTTPDIPHARTLPPVHPTLHCHDVTQAWRRGGARSWSEALFHSTYNARAALYQCLRSLPIRAGRSTILVPAFHCPTIVDAILQAGYRPLFYRVTRELTVDSDDVRRKLVDTIAAIVSINYCGFPADIETLLALSRPSGCFIIDDWAHSFLNARTGALTGEKGDAAIFSFYKIVPTGVGGGLRINNPELHYRSSNARVGLRHAGILVKRLIEEMIDNSDNHLVRSGFHRLERIRVRWKRRRAAAGALPILEEKEPYAFDARLAFTRMPWFTQRLLASVDHATLIAVRRHNYELMSRHMRDRAGLCAVFRRLPEEVCPLAYPILLQERSRHDWRLRAAGVPVFTFGETLHPLVFASDARTINDAVYLSQHLLLVAIHQDLSAEVVTQAAQTLDSFFTKAA